MLHSLSEVNLSVGIFFFCARHPLYLYLHFRKNRFFIYFFLHFFYLLYVQMYSQYMFYALKNSLISLHTELNRSDTTSMWQLLSIGDNNRIKVKNYTIINAPVSSVRGVIEVYLCIWRPPVYCCGCTASWGVNWPEWGVKPTDLETVLNSALFQSVSSPSS